MRLPTSIQGSSLPGTVEVATSTPEKCESRLLDKIDAIDQLLNPTSTDELLQRVERVWTRLVDAKLNDFASIVQHQDRERAEIEALRQQLQSAIDTAEARVATHQPEALASLEELEHRVIAIQDENTRLSNLLHHSREEYHTLLHFIETERIANIRLDSSSDYASAASSEIANYVEQIEFLQNELHSARQHAGLAGPDVETRLQIEQLRSQLLQSRSESVELRLQTEELSARLVRFQGPNDGQRCEALSWEDRKAALLSQLEFETHDDVPCDPIKVLDIERIIDETNREIERRDDEIMDLKALLAQQSVTQDGLAIGAAALADVVEADALIIAERLRLKELQTDWEQRQRQAEIEMSLERAKLARERLALQEKLRDIETEDADLVSAGANRETKVQGGKSRGRWLARLGLREE